MPDVPEEEVPEDAVNPDDVPDWGIEKTPIYCPECSSDLTATTYNTIDIVETGTMNTTGRLDVVYRDGIGNRQVVDRCELEYDPHPDNSNFEANNTMVYCAKCYSDITDFVNKYLTD